MNKYIKILAPLVIIGCIAPAKLVETKNNETVKFVPLPQSRIESVNLEYTLPSITPLDNTEQIQTKGGITISCAIQPVDVIEKSIVEETPSVVEPDAYTGHRYDRIEKTTTPIMKTTPDEVIFTIKIRNNSGKILRLSSIGLALLQDQKLYDLPKESREDWGMGLILNGFEKPYTIHGPPLTSIGDQVIYGIILQDVPTTYDSSGMVKKVETFEWFYELKLNKQFIQKNKQYEYYTKSVQSEQCNSCKGRGYNVERAKCNLCNGSGKTYNIITGQYYVCSRCEGSGVMNVKVKCPNQSCEQGQIYHPESNSAHVISRHSEYLNVYSIGITASGTSCGVESFHVTGDSGSYDWVGKTPIKVRYEVSQNHSEPLIITCNGNRYNLYPEIMQNGSYPGVIKLKMTDGVLTGIFCRIEKIEK